MFRVKRCAGCAQNDASLGERTGRLDSLHILGLKPYKCSMRMIIGKGKLLCESHKLCTTHNAQPAGRINPVSAHNAACTPVEATVYSTGSPKQRPFPVSKVDLVAGSAHTLA